MHPKWVQIAEHTRTLELPASDKVVWDSLSNKVVVGREFVSLTSVVVSLLTKITSPFQAVYMTSPGGSSEISTSL
jgi:hypothetical protein